MKTKKITRMILILLGIILLSACSGEAKRNEADTPEKSMQYVMESLKSLDLKTFNRYTDNYVGAHWNWIGFPVRKEYRVFNELLQPGTKNGKRYEANQKFAEMMVEHLTWEITDVRKEDDQAEIDLEITNLDMTDVTGNYMIFVLENMLDSEGTGLKQLAKDMSDLASEDSELLSIMDRLDENSTCTLDVTVLAYEEKGQWKIRISDEFVNAFMGNMNMGSYSEEVEQQIDELEDQYEQKMDAWGETFLDRVERQVDQWFD